MRRQLPSKRQALAKRISQLPVSVQALLIQLAVLPVTVLLVVLTPLREAGVLSVALLQGILAAGLSARFRLPVGSPPRTSICPMPIRTVYFSRAARNTG